MDAKDFETLEKTYDFSGNIYLTAISLFQGISLALLLSILVTLILPDSPTKAAHIKKTIQFAQTWEYVCCFIFCGVVVFAVWHHYVYRILYLKWYTNILDSIIPFVLGTSEIMMILILGKLDENPVTYWYFSAAFVSFCAIFAYWHGAFKANPETYPDEVSDIAEEHCKYLQKVYHLGIRTSSAVCILFIISAFVKHSSILFCLIFAILLAHIFKYERIHSQKIKPNYLNLEKAIQAIRRRNGMADMVKIFSTRNGKPAGSGLEI